MAHKYERKCWYCGNRDMEKTEYGVKCRACQATWGKLPPFYPPLTTERGVIIRDKDGKRIVRTGQVSTAHARKVALQRQSHISEFAPKE